MCTQTRARGSLTGIVTTCVAPVYDLAMLVFSSNSVTKIRHYVASKQVIVDAHSFLLLNALQHSVKRQITPRAGQSRRPSNYSYHAVEQTPPVADHACKMPRQFESH